MRPIKFRAYNEKGKCWYTEDFVKVNFFMLAQKENVQQFTGLLDKNGKEIYEGDLLREWVWVVEEHPSDFVYKVGFDSGHFTLTDIHNGYDRMGIWNVNHNMEVIGNIYENSDLTKE